MTWQVLQDTVNSQREREAMMGWVVLLRAGRARRGDPPDKVAVAERTRRAAPGTLSERDAPVAGAGDERRVGGGGRGRDEGGGGDEGEDGGEAHSE